VAAAARSFWRQGVRSRYRRDYWRFLGQAARVAPRRFGRAVALAVHAEHFIRYTVEDILPRLERERAPLLPLARPTPAPTSSGVGLVQITPRAS
jgi:hypothetical protein